jgi:lycopene cyclase CruA
MSADLERARARVRESGGIELLERLEHLDRLRTAPARAHAAVAPVERGDGFDFDVTFAGGGLSLVLATSLARQGLRVGVFDRARVGAAHREWNASRAELEALVEARIVTASQLEELIVARYDDGFCRWHGGGTYPVRRVLDHAVDAGKLLELAREAALQSGAKLFDHCEVEGYSGGAHGARLRARTREGAPLTVTTRAIVEARGASRPGHVADLLCPTVGGVLEGLEEGEGALCIDPHRGEILVTTEDVEEGRQHIWEGFPAHAGQTTVYLFYYAPAGELAPNPLLSLYDRFFRTLPRYKRGTAKLVRPTFGIIPGWSRMGPSPRASEPRIALVGDAAARHSPLTFCGFGAMLRSIGPATRALVDAMDRKGPFRLDDVVHDTALHGGTGALAMMMARPDPDRPRELNRLLDVAFGTLHAMGDEAYGALLRDELPAREFAEFLLTTSARHPRVYRDVVRTLGLRTVLGWTNRVFGAAVSERSSGPLRA